MNLFWIRMETHAVKRNQKQNRKGVAMTLITILAIAAGLIVLVAIGLFTCYLVANGRLKGGMTLNTLTVLGMQGPQHWQRANRALSKEIPIKPRPEIDIEEVKKSINKIGLDDLSKAYDWPVAVSTEE